MNVRKMLRTTGWVMLSLFLVIYVFCCLFAIVFLIGLWLIE